MSNSCIFFLAKVPKVYLYRKLDKYPSISEPFHGSLFCVKTQLFWRQLAQVPVFSLSRPFGARRYDRLPLFRPSLSVGPSSPQKTGYAGPAPPSGLVNQIYHKLNQMIDNYFLTNPTFQYENVLVWLY